MKEGKKAAFSFEKYEIPSFSFSQPNSEDFGIKFDLQGFYNEAEGVYQLFFNVIAEEDLDGNIFVDVKCVAFFQFEPNLKLEALPGYFYRNGIAIVFPYVRAFISTLTIQANTKILLLPVLNLSDLEGSLKEKTQLINLKSK